MQLYRREELIERARYLYNKYGFDSITALQIAEEELEGEEHERITGQAKSIR